MFMAGFLTEITTFFNAVLNWIVAIMNYISGNAPLTILVLAMPIIGFSIGLLRRLVRS